MKTVTVEISPEGEVTIEAHNFKGVECEKATKALEDALGTTSERKKKPEYRQVCNNTQRS